MTRYSLEPPRTNLVAHHTFDDVDGNTVVDRSPQANDGAVVGDVTFGYTGVVGAAARMQSDDDNITVSGLSSFFPMDALTASVWGRSENVVVASDTNVSATIQTDTNTVTLSHTADADTTGWQFAALRYDSGTVQLWYGSEDESPVVVASQNISGVVEDFDVSVLTNGYGYVDDVRVYRTGLDETHIAGIYTIATDHVLTDELAGAWPTPGIPFRGRNADFAGTLAEHLAADARELDAILDARRIQTAAGKQLDDLGRRFGGISRKTNELDDKYRRRIIGRVTAERSSGTFRDLLSAATTVIGTTENSITLSRQPDATALVSVDQSVIDASVLTPAEIESILTAAVPAGHSVTVQVVGTTPFTIKGAGDVDDSERGLTADNSSVGGTLIGDV
jgi:hypothetical protein